MKYFEFKVQAGNTIGRGGRGPRLVSGLITIDVNSNDAESEYNSLTEEALIYQELQHCVEQIKQRLERSFPIVITQTLRTQRENE
jgi:hypothetical protein